MIPKKDSNILLLPVTDGWVSNPFNMPGFPGYNKNRQNHNGVDLGWHVTQYCDVLAVAEGKVVQTWNNNASMGNGVCIQHDVDDGSHFWSAYIHLRDVPIVKKNDSVKQGQKIGVRGGSPYIDGRAKYGTHLHLYATKCTTKAYSWNTVKELAVDPLPLLYQSEKITYNALYTDLIKLPILEKAIVDVVEPVERNPEVNQLTESSSILRVRMAPSVEGTIIGYLKANVYYNYYDVTENGGYEWFKIAENQWCAKTSTMTVLPAETECELLKKEYERLLQEFNELGKENEKLKGQIEQIRRIIEE